MKYIRDNIRRIALLTCLIYNQTKFCKRHCYLKVMKCSCKRTAVRLEKDYRQRSARHKLKKHNKMADEVRALQKLKELRTKSDNLKISNSH